MIPSHVLIHHYTNYIISYDSTPAYSVISSVQFQFSLFYFPIKQHNCTESLDKWRVDQKREEQRSYMFWPPGKRVRKKSLITMC